MPKQRIIHAYRILGLNRDATESEIRAAHRSLVQMTHPDRAGTATTDSKHFQLVQEAYELLKNSARRAELDRILNAKDERARKEAEAPVVTAVAATVPEQDVPSGAPGQQQSEESTYWATQSVNANDEALSRFRNRPRPKRAGTAGEADFVPTRTASHVGRNTEYWSLAFKVDWLMDGFRDPPWTREWIKVLSVSVFAASIPAGYTLICLWHEIGHWDARATDVMAIAALDVAFFLFFVACGKILYECGESCVSLAWKIWDKPL